MPGKTGLSYVLAAADRIHTKAWVRCNKGRGEIMKTGSVKIKMVQSLALLAIAGTMMGNQSCDKAPEARELRRRVQMGKVTAPPIPLPTDQFAGRKFDFAYAANTQISSILMSTKAFSTAAVDPNESFNPDGLSEEAKKYFNQCGDEVSTQEFDKLSNAPIHAKMGDASKDAACLIGSPAGLINASIIDFSFKDGFGMDLSLKNLPINMFNFNVETYQLRVGMQAHAPYDNSAHDLAAITRDDNANKGQIGAGLNFGEFGLGLKYYYSSPLGKLVNTAFTNAVNDLKNKWNEDPGNRWYSMVLRNCDKYVYLDAGGANDVGLKVGDILEIKNVKYFWEGKRCASALDREIDAETIAYVKIKNIGRNMAEGEIIEGDPAYPQIAALIYPGARAYMHKFVEQVEAEKKAKK